MILDLHVHSCYSYDSLAKPEHIIRAAKRNGLTGVAITDHETIRGGVEVARVNTDPNFTVVVGTEIATDIGDIVGLFLTENIKSRDSLDVVDEIHRQGGIAILPHPYKGHKLNDDIIKAVDAIEIFNSRTCMEKNAEALALAEQHQKPMVAGSDAHLLSEIGTSRIMLESSNIRGEILAGRAVLNTNLSPPYKQSLSQIIKSVKKGTYTKIPYQLAVLVCKVAGLKR